MRQFKRIKKGKLRQVRRGTIEKVIHSGKKQGIERKSKMDWDSLCLCRVGGRVGGREGGRRGRER